MEIIEYAKYMQGEEYFGELEKKREETALTLDEMTKLLNKVYHVFGVEQSIKEINTPKAFYQVFDYIKNIVPKEHQEEIFYVLKTGKYSPEVPAKILFAAARAAETGAVNNFVKQFTPKELESIFMKGYLAEGFTMRDAIASVVGDFHIITEWKPVVPSLTKGFSEVYIKSQDYVACIPTETMERFSLEDLKDIQVKKGYMVIGKARIARMAPVIGVTDAIFDLRNTR